MRSTPGLEGGMRSPSFQEKRPHLACNYRPVSLTSITCKLLEHIVHSNVIQHFYRYDVLSDNQHGFRKRRSCETQLLTTIQEIASSTAKGKQVDVNIKRWIQSFLSNRKQQVFLDGAKSRTADVLSAFHKRQYSVRSCFSLH